MNAQTTKLARREKPNPLSIEIWTQYVSSDVSLRELGREYGRSQTAIRNVVVLVDKWVLKETQQVAIRIKWQQTRALWKQIRELEALYETSKEAEIERREERDDAGLLTRTVEIRRERIGDSVKCLEAIRKAMGDIRRIWGADAPTKTEAKIDGQFDVSLLEAGAAQETDENLQILLDAGDRWLRGETISHG